MLFAGAKIFHLGMLPQGEAERQRRASAMVAAMDDEGFGACGNLRACEAACPKEISISAIARMNRDYRRAILFGRGTNGGKRSRRS